MNSNGAFATMPQQTPAQNQVQFAPASQSAPPAQEAAPSKATSEVITHATVSRTGDGSLCRGNNT